MDTDAPQEKVAPSPLKVAVMILLGATLLLGAVIVFAPGAPQPQPDAPDNAAQHTGLVNWNNQQPVTGRRGWYDRPVMLVFTADYCPPCQYMKDEVYSDPEVADLINQNFIPIQVDLSTPGPEHVDLSRQFDVEYLPTIVILNQAQREVVRSQTIDAAQMKRMLGAALRYIEQNPPRPRRRYGDWGGDGYGAYDRDNDDNDADDYDSR